MTARGCIQPGEVAPEAIVAYVDGEAVPAVEQHLRRCPECAAEAREVAGLQNRLRAVLYRFNCPPTQLLGEYVLDLVTPEARVEIARHALECPHCTAELQSLRTFLAPDVDLDQAPASGLLEQVRRVVATLFVPPVAPVGAAVRGGVAGEGGQTYRAGDLSITLGPGPRSRWGRAALMGLIVRESGELEIDPDSAAQLIAPSGDTVTAAIDERGNFAFDDLPPGTYRLELRLPDQVVVVQDIPLER